MPGVQVLLSQGGNMIGVVFATILAVIPFQEVKEVTPAEKMAFLELLKKLPSRGEFFTQEAVKMAASYTRVLLALTAKDIQGFDLYPFLALSRGLLDHKEQREYGVKHFDRIAIPRSSCPGP